jgi:hypothetical protein
MGTFGCLGVDGPRSFWNLCILEADEPHSAFDRGEPGTDRYRLDYCDCCLHRDASFPGWHASNGSLSFQIPITEMSDGAKQRL